MTRFSFAFRLLTLASVTFIGLQLASLGSHGTTRDQTSQPSKQADSTSCEPNLLSPAFESEQVWIRSSQQDPRPGGSLLPEEMLEELLGPRNSERIRDRAELAPGFADRHRTPSALEKQAAAELQKYDSITRKTRGQLASLKNSDNKLLGYAAVVHEDGWLVAKASELENQTRINCRFSEGSSIRATVLARNEEWDLALLKVSESGLTPVSWKEQTSTVGTMVVSGDETGQPLWAGIVGVEARPLIHGNQAVLGVVPQPAENGVIVSQVAVGSSASIAGVVVGDLIESIDGHPVRTVNGLTNRIRKYRPGDQIVLSVMRNDTQRSITAVLGGRDVSRILGMATREFSQFGAEVNSRSSDFPLVFQHDMPLWPEQSGTLVQDLSGAVIGFNIARGGRIESYAIPSQQMIEVVEELLNKAQVD